MTIWGLIIGGAAGFALGGPIGALLGAAAGHLTERKIRDQLDPEQSRKVAFTVGVTAPVVKLFAVISNADNKVFASKGFFSNKAQLSNIKRFSDCNSYIKECAFFYARKFRNISRNFIFEYTKVYVVQKTKKTLGEVVKVNIKKAIVMLPEGKYNVPLTMLEVA